MTPAAPTVPRVLMVTGAYYPELSGAGLQCRALVAALGDRARCTVLTTATDRALPPIDRVDGVDVYRVHVDVDRVRSLAAASLAMVGRFLALRHAIDVVHLHGFSRKSVLLVWLARLTGKKIVIKLTSAGDDDPVSMRRRSRMQYAAFSRADAFVAVSPELERQYEVAGLPAARLRRIPNGVDLNRFAPATPAERRALRCQLGLPLDATLVLFVGFFSREKAPDVLFDAWRDTSQGRPETALVFIGATRSRYFEVDPAIAERIRGEAERLGISYRVTFVERTDEIEKYYRAADIFAMPSLREGLPNVLLEAMSVGLPCIASRLAGVTDALIVDGDSGLLVPPGDRRALAAALTLVFGDPALAARLGKAARAIAASGYSLTATAERYAALYRDLGD